LREIAEATRLARRAVDLGSDDAVALSSGGYSLAYISGDLDAGALFIDRALVLNPNLAQAWIVSAWLRINLGEPELAVRQFEHVMRLSPFEPMMHIVRGGIAFAYFVAGDFDKACSLAEMLLREKPDMRLGLRVAAAAHALAGRLENSHAAMARLRQLDPRLRISDLMDLTPFRRPQDLARHQEALRMAGLPE
jgi:adenylate cyclase